ncbi:unnamed protein product, partial [Mesorhabditis belari]|uniref:F-box domain-containing protein n=1 Tax=Mesorhabditis belari TaxID=2138241 RepID=A0AAF3E914_9BILA
MSSFRSNSWRTPLPPRSAASFACPFPFRVIPNLPDVVLRKVFSMLSYKELCACEVVCRRWQTIIHQQMKKDIQEITLESIGSYKISCPSTSADFLGGVIRRHRLSLSRLTTDFRFLSTIDSIKVNKDARRKYFGKVDDLWVLIVGLRDEDVQHYRAVEERIFNELTTLTLQLMISSRNVIAQNAIVVSLFSLRHPQAHITLELHADNANLVFTQLEALESIAFLKIKIICTEFNLPTLPLEKLSEILATKRIGAKIITFRDWTLSCDGVTPVVPCPLDTFRISSCTIDSVDALVDSFKAAVKQAAPKKLVKKVVKKKAEEQPPSDEEPKPKKKIVRKVKKRPPVVKRVEVAGQCTLRGLDFLHHKAHMELENRLSACVPSIEVDTSEIYYWDNHMTD